MDKCRAFLFIVFLLICLSACKKEEKAVDDQFIEDLEELSELNLEVSAIGQDFIEIEWDKVYSNHFKAFTYSIILNDRIIISDVTTNKYSFIGLEEGKQYVIKVLVYADNQQQIEKVLEVSTLLKFQNPDDTTIYKEYSIHSYSTITGSTAVQQFRDGGHLIVRTLRHPSNYSNDSFKILAFRTDKNGSMLWYRLLSYVDYGLNSTADFYLTLHEQSAKGILLCGDFVFDISVNDGELSTAKKITEIDGSIITASHKLDENTIIAGTINGELFSIDIQRLTVGWIEDINDAYVKCLAISKDSKNNLFVLYNNGPYAGGIHLIKYTGQGLRLRQSEFSASLVQVSLVVDEDDNLAMISSGVDFARLFLIKTNNDLEQISSHVLNENLFAAQAFLNHKNDIVVYGRHDGGRAVVNGSIFILDKDLNIRSRKVYTDIPLNQFRGVTQNTDGSFNIFLDFAYDKPNFVYIKSDSNGNL